MKYLNYKNVNKVLFLWFYNKQLKVVISVILKKVIIKDVVYCVTDAWEQISADALQKSWWKLWKSYTKGNKDKQADNVKLTGLIQLPGSENSSESIVQEWFNEHEQYVITDSSILDMVCTNSDTRGRQ